MDFKKPLAWFARKIIAKYQPQVIGVTGSVGKTSTRHAIASVLASKYTVREPIKNYNNELGIPLTIIGARGLDEGGGQLGWLRIFLHAAKTLWFSGSYPKIAVLEYGIDRPGDMDTLLGIVQPSVAVLTTIGISHREFFDTESEIAFEKGKIAAGLHPQDMFVYNIDDPHVAEQTKRTRAQTLSYGRGELAQVRLLSVEEKLSLSPSTTLHIQTPTRKLMVSVPVVGEAHVSAVLAAVVIAEHMELETDLITKGLANYRPVPGRLNILAGIKKTIIIDDTYNAAPLSMKEALLVLQKFPGVTKIAVLGDMLELGDMAESSHQEIGQMAAGIGLEKLYTVGQLGKIMADSAKKAGMDPQSIISFDTSQEAAAVIQGNLQTSSVILIKGSQGIRMEKITKEILAEPMSATTVLCRQYGKWLES